MKPTFDSRLTEDRAFIGRYLQQKLDACRPCPQETLYDAMGYSLLAGGKRLRPVFAFEFCRMCGGSREDAAPFAAAVEMIHTYSLIHDDLPCMDNDDYRRGRLTNHKVYGEAAAVLAGDALLTDAFSVAVSAPLPAETVVKALSVLADCAGSRGMVGGQVLDMQSEQRVCTEQEVLDIQSRKTGALIRAACCLGVLAGGGSAAQLQAAEDYAAAMGLAFQIRDDMLDVIGNVQELGKAVGMDAQKNTFVRLYGLDRCDELVRRYTETAIAALDAFPDADWLKALSRALTERTV